MTKLRDKTRKAQLTILDQAHGAVVYRGRSQLDRKPIVGILTGLKRPSDNVKTGPMAQLWILREDVAPHLAVKTGEDASVCGDCPLRRSVCYVTMHQAPLSVWKTYKEGGYFPATWSSAVQHIVKQRAVRLGAYGDPVALPFALVETIALYARRYTGYTHQWRRKGAQKYRRYLMASVETEEGLNKARGMGWRTFRVRGPEDEIMPGEIDCPHYTHGVTCIECGLCDGWGTSRNRKDIVVEVHGAGAGKFKEVK